MPIKILDLDIIRVNHQIHREALRIFRKGNTFQYNLLCPKAMKYASGIKVYIYLRHHQDLAKFVQFLQSRTKLNSLHLTLHGSTWNSNYLRFLFICPGTKVSKHVSIEPVIPYWDAREGSGQQHYTFWALMKKFEKDMLVSGSH